MRQTERTIEEVIEDSYKKGYEEEAKLLEQISTNLSKLQDLIKK